MNSPDPTLIPKGDYCYDSEVCPYWKSKEIAGVKCPWCLFLNKGGDSNYHSEADFDKLKAHFGSDEAVWKALPLDLLWDQVKECGQNFYTPEEEAKFYS